jgi:hypothetical protein
MNTTMFCAISLSLIVAGGIFSWKSLTRAGYESAEYKVLDSEGQFEVREYPDLMMAAATTQLDAQGRDGSFMKLFGYISGANTQGEKIAMTTPVFMENQDAGSRVQMGFVMPKDVAQKGVPNPTESKVQIRKRAGGRFAVIRFSGQLNTNTAEKAEAKLREWMKNKKLVGDDSAPGSGVETAGYDPPFTPGPLRRNEVLIRLETGKGNSNPNQ